MLIAVLSPVYALTNREYEIVLLLMEGASNKEMAGFFGVSVQTIKNHITNAFAATGTRSRTGLAVMVWLETEGRQQAQAHKRERTN